jgi:PAS domain S-box-containing protein
MFQAGGGAVMNRAAVVICGVSREIGEGRHIFDLGILDEEGMAQSARNLALVSDGVDPGPAEYTFHRPDGSRRQVEVIGHMMEIHAEPRMLTIVHDITRRKRLESEVQRGRSRLEEAQRVAGVVTFEIDLRSGEMVVSPGLEIGSRSSDGQSRISLEEGFSLIHADDRERMVTEIRAAVSGGGSGDIVVECRRPAAANRREATVRSTARAERDENGNVIKLIGATFDISAIRLAEQEIRVLNAELEARVEARTSELQHAVQELSAFSYSVSHDLRSPLRAMAGYSDLVLEEDGERLSESSREHLARIRASSIRLGGLIDGLLSLSRLTRATRNDAPVDLSAMAREILAQLRRGEVGREVETVVEEGLEVVADEGMMFLVLQNLLSNAWKFTRSAEGARIVFGRDRGGAYFVRDNGVGFDDALSAKLFRPFERLHRVDEFEGTGIGLATVDRIVRHHGGKVGASSTLGKGATFWFTLGAVREVASESPA